MFLHSSAWARSGTDQCRHVGDVGPGRDAGDRIGSRERRVSLNRRHGDSVVAGCRLRGSVAAPRVCCRRSAGVGHQPAGLSVVDQARNRLVAGALRIEIRSRLVSLTK